MRKADAAAGASGCRGPGAPAPASADVAVAAAGQAASTAAGGVHRDGVDAVLDSESLELLQLLPLASEAALRADDAP